MLKNFFINKIIINDHKKEIHYSVVYIISVILITAIAVSCNKEEKAPVTKDKVEKTEPKKKNKNNK